MPIHILINPMSGAGGAILRPLHLASLDAGVQPVWRITADGEDARNAAREAQDAGADRVVVVGGDGTFHLIASELAGADIPLAIFPAGTSNVLARELGIPLDGEQAARLAVGSDGVERGLDGIRVRDRLFFQRVGIGADARTVAGASREAKEGGGRLAYLFQAIAQLGDPGSATYRVEADGVDLELEAVTCVLANCGRYGGAGMRLAQGIEPDDGLLDVLLLENSRWQGLRAVGLSTLGLGDDGSDPMDPEAGPLRRIRTDRVTVRCEPEQDVHGDGEDLGSGDVEAVMEPACVRVIVPGEA